MYKYIAGQDSGIQNYFLFYTRLVLNPNKEIFEERLVGMDNKPNIN